MLTPVVHEVRGGPHGHPAPIKVTRIENAHKLYRP